MKPIEKESILRDATYWEELIKTQLFQIVEQHLEDNQMTKKDFAHKIGVSKGYVSQVLNGDRDHRLSKIVEFALAVGKAPFLCLQDLNKVIEYDQSGISVIQQGQQLEADSFFESAMERLKASQIKVTMQYKKDERGLTDSEARAIPLEGDTSVDFDDTSINFGQGDAI
jgi:predicted XRE-type DNA-binding protein